MKLIFIVDKYPPIVDGVGDYTNNIVNEYCRRGNEVFVICCKDERIDTKPKNGSVIFPIISKWNLAEFKKATDKINEIRPDWVLFQYVPYTYQKKGMPVWLPRALKKIDRTSSKLLIRIHEPFIRLQIFPPKLFLLGVTQRWIAKSICNLADKVLVSTDLYKTFIDQYSKTKASVVPIGSNIIPVEISKEANQELKLKVAPNGEKIISTFGIRDHKLLIDVFKVILEKNKQFKLLVCGVVKDKTLYKSIEHNVFVTGFLASNEVYSYLSCSDVFFMPDEIDEHGSGGSSNKSTSLAAGFAANIPVIGIKGDMNNNLLSENKALYLENAHDPSAIADRIISIVSLNIYKNESYEFWKRFLAWDKIVDSYNL